MTTEVTEVTWVAHRVEPSELPGALALAESLGLTVADATSHHVELRTGRGDLVEYVTDEHGLPAHLFAGQQVVVGLKVPDLEEAVARLSARGFEVVAPPQSAGPVRFAHFRGPGGTVHALIADA
ncbi:MAG TPA: VOC family protein [Naasia sp.]|jgi:4-hydroxyphenylpyruvate dioxygenase-like putative hemolysin